VAPLQATYGFLYLEYGPSAWWWEVEELVRKLLLSSLVVLIDAGSPLQVRARRASVFAQCTPPAVGVGGGGGAWHRPVWTPPHLGRHVPF
jgi:hypothetical protein